MRIFDIALKDLRHSFRSAFALMFMFVIPLLTVGLFYLAFGGLASDGGGFNLATIHVRVANLDEPPGEVTGFSAGEMLTEFLASDDLANLLAVETAPAAAVARAVVDRQEAAVAVIIPPDFTTAVVEPEGEASVELYYDPTLQIGPGIVEDVVSQFVDGLAGSRLAAEVAGRQLSEYGSSPEPQRLREISMAYGDWSSALGESQPEGASPLIDARAPRETETEDEDLLTVLLRPIMGGMMIFYAFFTGASASQSILDEEEAGTLSRLFTTPTPLSNILGGKLLAVFVTIFIQVVVLMTIAALVFHVGWGGILPLTLVTLGLVVLASSFGIFLTSLLKDTGQAGLVFGGVMTVTGMVGINAMFTANVPGGSSVSTMADTVALLVPQGWAMRGWRTVMAGGGVSDVLPTAAVMLLLGAAFFVVGTLRFRKRFA